MEVGGFGFFGISVIGDCDLVDMVSGSLILIFVIVWIEFYRVFWYLVDDEFFICFFSFL